MLVNPDQVSLSNDLEENSNFCIVENIFANVNAKELNDVLSSSGHTQVDKGDNNEINVEYCYRDEDKSIDEEEDISD